MHDGFKKLRIFIENTVETREINDNLKEISNKSSHTEPLDSFVSRSRSIVYQAEKLFCDVAIHPNYRRLKP